VNHDKKVHEGLEYILLYPDHSEVINLPGTTDEFVLEKNRENAGEAYNRITLFIAPGPKMNFYWPSCHP